MTRPLLVRRTNPVPVTAPAPTQGPSGGPVTTALAPVPTTPAPQPQKAPVAIRKPSAESVGKVKTPGRSRILLPPREEPATITGQFVSHRAFDFISTLLPSYSIAVISRSDPLDPSGDSGTQRDVSMPHATEYTTAMDERIRAGQAGAIRNLTLAMDLPIDAITIDPQDGTCKFTLPQDQFLEYLDGQHFGVVVENLYKTWRETRDPTLEAEYRFFLFEMPVQVTILVNPSLEVKRQVFDDMNNKAKRVSGTHAVTLSGALGNLKPQDQLAFEVAQALQHLENQPFFGRINFKTNANKDYPISAKALVGSIVDYIRPTTVQEGVDELVAFFAPLYDAFRGDKRLFSAAIFNGLLAANYRGLTQGKLKDPANIAKLAQGDGLDRFQGMNGGGAINTVATMVLEVIEGSRQ